MKNLTGNRSVKWRMSKKKYEKEPISISYEWRKMMDLKPGEEFKKLNTFPYFASGVGALKIEDWCLDAIRIKFFRDLRDSKDYEKDKWMPKTMPIISYIMEREMVNLYDLALFFGMPRMYLVNLCRRDKGFRYWIIWLRHQRIEQKADVADASRSTGMQSLLNRWQPHWNSQRGLNAKPLKNPIDVGWKGKKVSLKL